ncbi:MAG: hypothetical protein KAR12_16855 [Methylococcales bacterium]|nr:hypothetical protein [Methylococcales bacterium]
MTFRGELGINTTSLCLGYKTVADYVTQIKKKLQVSSMTKLFHMAIMPGIMKH